MDVFDFSDPMIFWTMMGVLVLVVKLILDWLIGAIRSLFRLLRPKPAEVQQVQIVAGPATAPSFPKINPPPRERSLVGRRKELEKIRDILAARQGVVITNTRGVALKADGGRGKTTLAREFAEMFGKDYGGGKWLRAQSRLTLLDDLAALGDAAFGMAVPSPVTEAHGLAVLDRIADSGARWLLVYDNVDDHAEIKSLIAHGANIDVIVTTRLGLGWDGFRSIDLDVLDFATRDGDAVALLLQEAGLEMRATAAMREQAREVAEILGGLPLALVMAGTVMREDGIGLPELHSEIARVIERTPHNANYPDSVAGAVMVTYEKLKADGKTLADLCAWLAPTGLSERLFADAAASDRWPVLREEAPSEVVGLIEDRSRLQAAFEDLRRWSVFTGSGALQMHRLTQAVLRGGQGEGRDQKAALAVSAVLAVQFPERSNLVVNWPVCRALSPQVAALWDAAQPLWEKAAHACGWGRPGWLAMDYLLNQAGVYLSHQADIRGAIDLGRASLLLKEARLGEEHRGIPLGLGNLAQRLAETEAEADLREAEDMIVRAVALNKAHRAGEGRIDLAGTYMQQAAIAFHRIERSDGSARKAAEEVAEKALADAWRIRRELRGETSAEIGYIWNQTAYLRRLQRRKAAEMKAYVNALSIGEALPDADRRMLGSRLMNVGSTALEIGRVDDAEERLRQAYKIFAQVFDERPQHPSLRIAADWLATCLCKRALKGVAGALAEAEALCARHGLSLEAIKADAATLPDAPLDLPPDEDWPWSKDAPSS